MLRVLVNQLEQELEAIVGCEARVGRTILVAAARERQDAELHEFRHKATLGRLLMARLADAVQNDLDAASLHECGLVRLMCDARLRDRVESFVARLAVGLAGTKRGAETFDATVLRQRVSASAADRAEAS